MMYQDKLVVAIKSNGKILREKSDLVALPFGSEFSILIKNLNSRRVKFNLRIDGTDVLDGTEIIVDANSEIEMKRFIRNGNMNEGNAFKFIERTTAIEDGPRGVKVDDGIVRVEFWFEKEPPEVKTTIHTHNNIWWNKHHYRDYPSSEYYSDELESRSKSSVKGIIRSAACTDKIQTSYTGTSADTPLGGNASPDIVSNDIGITVPGSKVEQKFHAVYGFNSEINSHVIILRLTGTIGKIQIVEPVTVKSKQKCTTCGHTNKATSKFCSECGTALELV